MPIIIPNTQYRRVATDSISKRGYTLPPPPNVDNNRKLAIDTVDLVMDKATGQNRKSIWDKAGLAWSYITNRSAQNDPEYQKTLQQYTKMRTKAYAGYTYNKATGKWSKADNKVQNVSGMLDRVQNSFGSKGKSSGVGGWSPLKQETKDSISKGLDGGIKSSIGWGDVMKDPRGAVGLWAKNKGYNWLHDLSKDPTKFWGIAAGAVGIPLLVSSFIAGRQPSGQQQAPVVNNYYGGNPVPPATTSFWRHP